jgi:hypothetical protein
VAVKSSPLDGPWLEHRPTGFVHLVDRIQEKQSCMSLYMTMAGELNGFLMAVAAGCRGVEILGSLLKVIRFSPTILEKKSRVSVHEVLRSTIKLRKKLRSFSNSHSRNNTRPDFGTHIPQVIIRAVFEVDRENFTIKHFERNAFVIDAVSI